MIYNLSTEDLNSYGFWVLSSGINLDRYKKNPVITLNHNSYDMSVGKMNGIKKDNSALVGEPEFDEEDEKGKMLKHKYDKGYMNGFSIGIRVLEWSEDPKYLKPGQTRATVIKSELMETAAATVPSNASAIRLYDADGAVINLSEVNLNTVVPELQKNEIPEINKIKNKMKEIALALGLPENATEQEINAKIAELKAKQTTESNSEQLALAAMFISLGVAKGVIILEGPDANKEVFEELYGLNAKLAVKMVELFEKRQAITATLEVTDEDKAKKPKSKDESLSALLSAFGAGSQAAKTEKKWADLTQAEAEELREKNQAEYIKLYEAHYGIKPVL